MSKTYKNHTYPLFCSPSFQEKKKKADTQPSKMHFLGLLATVAVLFVATTVAVPHPTPGAIEISSARNESFPIGPLARNELNLIKNNSANALVSETHMIEDDMPMKSNTTMQMANNNSSDVALIPRQSAERNSSNELVPLPIPYEPRSKMDNPSNYPSMKVTCQQQSSGGRFLYSIQVYNSIIRSEHIFKCGEIFRHRMHKRCSASMMDRFNCHRIRNNTAYYMSFTVNIFCLKGDVELTLFRVYGLRPPCHFVDFIPPPEPPNDRLSWIPCPHTFTQWYTGAPCYA